MSPPKFHKGLLLPRYWLTWLGFGIWWLLAQLPYKFQMWLGSLLGKLMATVAKRRIAIAKRNLQLCFPQFSKAERDQLLQKHVESMGKTFFEIGIAWFWSKKRLHQLVSYEGFEHIKIAQQNKQGIILLTIHSSHMELTGSFVYKEHPMDITYRKHFNPVYDFVQKKCRTRFHDNMQTVERKEVRGMIKSLRSSRSLWYAPDQDFGINHSIFLPFFGVPAACLTTTTTLSKLGQACVIPLVSVRKPEGGYHLTVFPPLENFPSDDITEDTKLIVSTIEKMIKLAPEQYLWVHRRFKNRPEGEPDLYSRDLLRHIQ